MPVTNMVLGITNFASEKSCDFYRYCKTCIICLPFVSNREFHDLGDFAKITGHDYIF